MSLKFNTLYDFDNINNENNNTNEINTNTHNLINPHTLGLFIN